MERLAGYELIISRDGRYVGTTAVGRARPGIVGGSGSWPRWCFPPVIQRHGIHVVWYRARVGFPGIIYALLPVQKRRAAEVVGYSEMLVVIL